MSIDVLLSGKIGRGGVTVKTAANGKPYARWQLQTVDKNGGYVLASCVAFRDGVIEAAQALTEGDSCAVSGEAAISQWTGGDGQQRTGLDVLAHAVLTAYAVQRKRKAVQGSQNEGKPVLDAARVPVQAQGEDFNDDVDF